MNSSVESTGDNVESTVANAENAETETLCSHGKVFQNACVCCKAPVNNLLNYTCFPGGHFFTAEECEKIQRAKGEQLIRDRKLMLLLDLDRTIIEATDFDFGIKSEEIIQFTLGPKKMFLIKRPDLDKFLERVSKCYEIHIVTAGSELYARKAVDIIDPTNLISREILCKEQIQATKHGKKVPLPDFGPTRLIVAVDDNDDVWVEDFYENVLQVTAFMPFCKLGTGLPYDYAICDNLLARYNNSLANILEIIHSEFFKQNATDCNTRVERFIAKHLILPRLIESKTSSNPSKPLNQTQLPIEIPIEEKVSKENEKKDELFGLENIPPCSHGLLFEEGCECCDVKLKIIRDVKHQLETRREA